MSDKTLKNSYYDIVNDQDEIIGKTTKRNLHTKGLTHRGVNVIFYNLKGEVFLQRRAPDKNTFPNNLDITVGGHVDSGDSYEEAALKETEEETGIKIKKQDLQFVTKIRRKNVDQLTKTTSDYFCTVYSYLYTGTLDQLKIESGKASGFVTKNIKSLIHPTPKDVSDPTLSFLLKDDYKNIWEKIDEKL